MKKNDKGMRKKDEHLISLFYRPFTEAVTKLLLKTSVTPNQITTLGIIISIISGVLFSFGDYKNVVIAGILAQFTLICDLLDGQIARAKNMKSVFGEWYDMNANKIMKYFMILGAGFGVYKFSNNPLILVVSAAAIFNITMISFISNMRHFFDAFKGHTELPRTKGFFLPFGMLTTTLLTISALFNRVSWFLWFFAIFGTLGWIKQFISHYKLGKGNKKVTISS